MTTDMITITAMVITITRTGTIIDTTEWIGLLVEVQATPHIRSSDTVPRIAEYQGYDRRVPDPIARAANAAPAKASRAASTIANRMPLARDSLRSASAIWRSSPRKVSRAGSMTNFPRVSSTARLTSADTLCVSKPRSRFRLKNPSATAPRTATASRLPTEAIALLNPEAKPARSVGTALMTEVVSGATLSAMPMPSATIGRKKVAQYDPPVPGTARRPKTKAAIAGPMITSQRPPARLSSPPDQRDNPPMMRVKGKNTAPVRVAEYPCT